MVTNNGDGFPSIKKEKIFQQGYGSNSGYGLFLMAGILTTRGITRHKCKK